MSEFTVSTLQETLAVYDARTRLENPALDRALAQVANAMGANATRAALETATDTATLIPAAAHQDGPLLEALLPQYAAQQDAPGLELAISANWPVGADPKRVKGTMDFLEDFRRTHSDFPFTFFATEYSPGTPIGTVRAHLWGGFSRYGLLGKSVQYDPEADILGISHDADGVIVPPGNAHHMRAALEPGIFVARGMADWQHHDHTPLLNLIYRLYALPWKLEMGVSGANTGLSVRKYLEAGGFNLELANNEVPNVIRSMPDFNINNVRTVDHPDATVVTSDRRFWRAALHPDDPRPPWEVDQSIGSGTEEYRQAGEPPHDITPELCAEWLRSFSEWFFPNAARHGLRKGENWVRSLVTHVEAMASEVEAGPFDTKHAAALIDRALNT